MKLMYCPKCGDIVRLKLRSRSCECGFSRGRYTDNINAVILNGIPIGFAGRAFQTALSLENMPGEKGHEFTAFVIPPNAPSIKRTSGENNER